MCTFVGGSLELVDAEDVVLNCFLRQKQVPTFRHY